MKLWYIWYWKIENKSMFVILELKNVYIGIIDIYNK